MDPRSLDELTSRDRRLAIFTPYGLAFGYEMKPDAQLAWLQNDITRYDLPDTVPLDVRDYFDAARHLYVYGFFQYEFFTLAFERALLSVEISLRVRFVEWYKGRFSLEHPRSGRTELILADRYPAFDKVFSYGGTHPHKKGWQLVDAPSFDGTLWSLLLWAYAKNLLPERLTEGHLRGLRGLRNHIAHPSYNMMIMPPDSAREIEQTYDFICALWAGNAQDASVSS